MSGLQFNPIKQTKKRGYYANNTELVQKLQKAVSDQGLHCWPTKISMENSFNPLAPITAAADDIHKYFFIVLQRK